MEGLSLKNMVIAIAAQNDMDLSDVAKESLMTTSNLHQKLKRKSITLSSLKDIMQAMGEDVVLVTKNGNKFKLEL